MSDIKMYPIRSVANVLGCLCQKPELLREPGKKLETDDFLQEAHQMIFDTINNLVYGEIDREKITPIDIDNYLSEYPDAYKLWEKYRGFDYIMNASELANLSNYSIDYDRVKKFSLLRTVSELGMNPKEFYDYDSPDTLDDDMKKLDELELNDIIDHYSKQVISLRDSFGVTEGSNTYKAGKGLEELIYRTDSTPQYGYPFRNRFYNTIMRGMETGRFLLRSADSGTGKTRNNLNDLLYISMPKMWSIEHNDFIDIGKPYPVLYIGTEEESEEIDMLILAVVSGIDQDVIKDGNFSKTVEERLLKAAEIIQSGELYIHRDDDFSITDIEMAIEKFIIDHGVQYVGFDYIQLTPKISRSALEMFGQQLREDLIISTFAGRLKDIAQKYNVFMLSSTQLNRNSADKTQRNGNCLAGGRATQNKVDHGIQLYRVDQEDEKNLEHIIKMGYEMPNYSHWFYKNRGGKYSDVIVWTKMNLGNMHEKELFVTDRKYNLIDVPLTTVNFEEGTYAKKDVRVVMEDQIPDF